MKLAPVASMKDLLEQVKNNPVSMQRVALDTLKQIHEGDVEVIDGATPFGFAIQAAAVMTSSFIDESVRLTRKQYPVAALTEDDLYLHMSDRDYINRFAMPSKARFSVWLDKNEILNRMVEDEELGISKIIIPRFTELRVNEVTFTLLYPIEIRRLRHGGIQIVYDNNIDSPIDILPTNIINYRTHETNNIEWLVFDITLKQVSIKTFYQPTDSLMAPETDIILTDKFYFLRAFIERNGKWVEIKTTHTDQIYDISTLTAVLKVYQDRVSVKIPSIYNTLKFLTGRLRYDVYETQGDISLDLRSFEHDAFEFTYKNDDFDVTSNKFAAPVRNLQTISIISEDITEGGNDAMTVAELRNVVINNSVGLQQLPITPNQASTALHRAGYEIVKNVDNVTGRSFLATKQLPEPKNTKLITPASASIETIVVDEEEVKRLRSVKKNFRSVTITPDTLFKSESGVMKLVPSTEVTAVMSMSPELRAKYVSERSYYYTPFHYVLDFSQEDFNSRPFYLDSPVALWKNFISDNDRTLLQATVDEFEVERYIVPESPDGSIKGFDGYRILISTESSKEFRSLLDENVFVQLAFKPRDEHSYAYVNGTLIGKTEDDERVYEFLLDTNFYINIHDELELSNFKMFDESERKVYCAMNQQFEVLFATNKPMETNWMADEVDKRLGSKYLPDGTVGISNTGLTIRLGVALKNLWARNRSIINSAEYKRYEEDIPAFYTEDVYEVNPDTKSAVAVENGEVQYRIAHRIGDPILGLDGLPVMKHKRGDIILDKNGKPTFDNKYSLLRQLDIMMIEGEYYFATDSAIVDYRQEIVDIFVDWITDGLEGLSASLLDQTNIYFYPKSTTGQIEVMVNNSIQTVIDSGQRFKIRLYVSDMVYANSDLKRELTTATVRALNEDLQFEVVNKSNIITRLQAAYGEDVIGFEIEGLGGDKNTETITILNEAKRMSLRKRLVAQGDGSLIVEEDVTCDFIPHDKKNLIK